MTSPSRSGSSDLAEPTSPPPAGPPPSERPPRERRDQPSGPPLFSPAPDETAAAATTSPGPDDPEDSAGSSPGDEKGPGRRQRSDIRSTTRKRSSVKRKLQHAIAGGVAGASIQVNRVLARDAAELEFGPWVAEDADCHGIADPLSSLASRRAIGPDVANPDIADLIDAAVAIFAYVSKALRRRYELRRAIANGDIVIPPDTDTSDDAQPPDAVPTL